MSEEAVRACEVARVAAINARDWDRLATLLADDYLHVHGSGRVTAKAETLARLAAAPRAVTRGAIEVRLWPGGALLIGEQVNHDGAVATRGTVSQVLRETEGEWRFVSLHFTALRD